jgi:hypothetical protein
VRSETSEKRCLYILVWSAEVEPEAETRAEALRSWQNNALKCKIARLVNVLLGYVKCAIANKNLQ